MRSNLIAKTLLHANYESRYPCFVVPMHVQNGNDLDNIGVNKEISRKRKTSQQCSSHIRLDLRELKWRLIGVRLDMIDFVKEFVAKARLLIFIPSANSTNISVCARINPNRQRQSPRSEFRLWRRSLRTSSQLHDSASVPSRSRRRRFNSDRCHSGTGILLSSADIRSLSDCT